MHQPTTVHTADDIELEAELFVPDSPTAAVVIAHPHPQMGGDMYTPVVSALWQAIDRTSIAGLRFNFRGVGSSTGSFDNGVGERLDVAAALDRLAEEAPGVPLIASGWSFGADLVLASDDPRIAGWFLAAAPLTVSPTNEMPARTAAAPKHFAVPEHDQFSPPAKTTTAVANWTNASVVQVDGTDHVFSGAMAPLMQLFDSFVAEIVGDQIS